MWHKVFKTKLSFRQKETCKLKTNVVDKIQFNDCNYRTFWPYFRRWPDTARYIAILSLVMVLFWTFLLICEHLNWTLQ